MKKLSWLCISLICSVALMGMGCIDDDDDDDGVRQLPAQDGEFSGFLWKPRSESNGRLVVLLPNNLRGQVNGAGIYSSPTTSGSALIEQGRFAGDTHNGARPHYRFEMSGAGYGSDIWVVAQTDIGNLAWNIPNGASRWD